MEVYSYYCVWPNAPLQNLTMKSIFCYTPAYCKYPNSTWIKSVHRQPGVGPHTIRTVVFSSSKKKKTRKLSFTTRSTLLLCHQVLTLTRLQKLYGQF